MRLLPLFVFFLLILPAPAMAYLDPGSGSMIIQVLLAGILGAAFTLKMYWRRFIDFVTGRKSTTSEVSSNGTSTTSTKHS